MQYIDIIIYMNVDDTSDKTVPPISVPDLDT